MRRGIRSWLVLCAVPSVLLGQASGPAVKEGDRVRISAQFDPGIYIVRAVSRDTLTVQQPSSEGLTYFPVTALRRIDVSRGEENRGAVAIRRGLKGALGGAVVGGVGGYTMGDDPPDEWLHTTRKEKAAILGVALGVLGFTGGFISGLVGGGERWERVALPPRVGLATPRNGVYAVSYSF